MDKCLTNLNFLSASISKQHFSHPEEVRIPSSRTYSRLPTYRQKNDLRTFASNSVIGSGRLRQRRGTFKKSSKNYLHGEAESAMISGA